MTMGEQSQRQAYDLTHEDIEKVFATVDIPACPAIVAQVMAEAQKDEPDIRKLAKAIGSDVGMSAVTLKLANSPLFRIGVPVSTVLKALERLGINNALSVIVAAALREAMAGVSARFIEKFWEKTSTLAMAAGLIARRQYGLSPDAAYTYALFHDAGIPLMLRRFPEYEKALKECHATGRFLVDAENQYFPCTHPIIGSLLVRNWGLPPMMGQAIRFHHEPDVYELPDSTLPGGAVSLIAVTHVAEHLACEIDGEPDLEVGLPMYERALAHLGIDADEIEDLRETILAARRDK
jgi:HD-like signal output (HDOD) protein